MTEDDKTHDRNWILEQTGKLANELFETTGKPVKITVKMGSYADPADIYDTKEVAAPTNLTTSAGSWDESILAQFHTAAMAIELDASMFEAIRNTKRAELVWRGLAMQKVASQLWPSPVRDLSSSSFSLPSYSAAATFFGFRALFDLFIEEQDARRTISQYPLWRDAIQSATAFQYSRGGGLKARTILSAMESTQTYRERWDKFAFSFRCHGSGGYAGLQDAALDSAKPTGKAEQPIWLIPDFFYAALDSAKTIDKDLRRSELYDLARSVHEILSQGIELPAGETEQVVAEPAVATGVPASEVELIGAEAPPVEPQTAPETEAEAEDETSPAEAAAVQPVKSVGEHIKGWIQSARENPKIAIAVVQTTIAWSALFVGVFGVNFWNNTFWIIVLAVVALIAIGGTGFLFSKVDIGFWRAVKNFFADRSRQPSEGKRLGSRIKTAFKWSTIVIWGPIVLVGLLWEYILSPYFFAPIWNLISSNIRAGGRWLRDTARAGGRWLKETIFFPLVNGVDSLLDRLGKAWSSSGALHMWIALALLTIPLAVAVAMGSSVFIEGFKTSFWLLAAYGAFMAVASYLVYYYWKPLKTRVIGEVPLNHLPNLRALKQSHFIDKGIQPWEQISDAKSVTANHNVLARAMSQAGSAGDQLKQALLAFGIGLADQEDHSDGDDVQIEELVTLNELSFEKGVETPKPLSLHVELALDCSESNQQGFGRGQSFGLNVEDALQGIAGVTQQSSGYIDTTVFDCGSGEGRLSGLEPSLESGNNDLSMLEKMARRAQSTDANIKVLVVIGDGLPTEGSWGSLQKLARDLRNDGIIPIQVLTDRDSAPAFDLVVELFDDDAVAKAVRQFTTIVVDEVNGAFPGRIW